MDDKNEPSCDSELASVSPQSGRRTSTIRTSSASPQQRRLTGDLQQTNAFNLIQSSAKGSLATVQKLVEERGVSVTVSDYDDRTPLHLAAGEGRLAVVMYLLAARADPNSEDRWGGRPLDDAQHRSHAECAKALIAAGATAGTKGSHANTADLIDAASKGDLDTVQRLVEAEGLPLDVGDYDSRTALHLAAGDAPSRTPTPHAQRAHTALAPLPRAARARQPPRPRAGAGEGRLAVVAYLLVSGAEANPRDRWGGTPLDDAVRQNHDEVAKALRAAGGEVGGREHSKFTPTDLIGAASKGDLTQVMHLVEKEGLNIDSSDYDRRTPLHLAAGEGRLAVVAYLLAAGAEVNAEDRWGGTPLDDALRHRHREVETALRSAGGEEGGGDELTALGSTSYSSTRSFSGKGVQGHSKRDEAGEEFLLENLSVSMEDLKLGAEIGKGAFGVVRRGEWRGMAVACKMLHTGIPDDKREESKRLLAEERRLLIHLRHPNIVLLLGWAHAAEHDILISELMQQNLEVLLRQHIAPDAYNPRGRPAFSRQRAMHLLVQFAQGMVYLHSCRPPILHRDLKPANLLLDFTGTLKVGDFGLARARPELPAAGEAEVVRRTYREGGAADDGVTMTAEAGSYRYMAPEVFRHEPYSEKCDVYSFGMIGFHVLCFFPPFSDRSGIEAARMAALESKRPALPQAVEAPLSALLRQARASCLPPPSTVPHWHVQLLISTTSRAQAWAQQHAKRPAFSQILEMLNAHHQQTCAPRLSAPGSAPTAQRPRHKHFASPPPAPRPRYGCTVEQSIAKTRAGAQNQGLTRSRSCIVS